MNEKNKIFWFIITSNGMRTAVQKENHIIIYLISIVDNCSWNKALAAAADLENAAINARVMDSFELSRHRWDFQGCPVDISSSLKITTLKVVWVKSLCIAADDVLDGHYSQMRWLLDYIIFSRKHFRKNIHQVEFSS